MSKILVLGDIHGRNFWKKPCENLNNYDKVVFLGDYFDPYDFEKITIIDCINNFKEIIELKEKYDEKIVLLIGNHDYPYYSKDYFNFSWYHCRHSSKFHKAIADLFETNRDKFKLAHVEEDILFTHAGVESGWLENVVKCKETEIDKICDTLNSLQNNVDGQSKLYSITSERGGRDKYGSCIWADVHDIMWDVDSIKNPETIVKPIHKIKQVFGHTIQAFYGEDRKIVFGDAMEFDNCKMVDTAKPYLLNTEDFTLTKI